MDALFLSRIQFAFTIAYHILFPALNIGLGCYLFCLEWKWFKTRNPIYKSQHDFWLKIFSLSFGVGVVTGVMMAYQFGTNWAHFIRVTGNIVGPLMAYEILTAFFLEAGFLGIMLFGRNRVSEKMYLFANGIVCFGTILSAFWIIAVNSWMHTPAGYRLEHGIFYPESWLKIIFNPSVHHRFPHMLMAAIIATTFFMAAISAHYLLKNKNAEFAKKSLSFTMLIAVIVLPIQMILGDFHGVSTFHHQPLKIAAMEAIWETQKGAPTILFALPDEKNEKNHYEIGIPHGASVLLTHSWNGEIPGLKTVPPQDRPPVLPVFFGFRIMVGAGVVMLLIALWGLFLRSRKKLFESKLFLTATKFAAPLGFIAIIAGWCVTEVGRQPYMVYGLFRTK
jgi:cytochrome d ubiquinol oxidase subunit I